MDNILEFKTYKEGVSNLSQMLDIIQHKIVSLNIISTEDDSVVSSNTFTFAIIGEDEIRDDLMLVTSGVIKHQMFISKKHLNKYILYRVDKTMNGYDHHFFFEIKI